MSATYKAIAISGVFKIPGLECPHRHRSVRAAARCIDVKRTMVFAYDPSERLLTDEEWNSCWARDSRGGR